MNTVSYKYAEIIAISVEQMFYTNKYSKRYEVEPTVDVLFAPTADCLTLMRRLDMLFRVTDFNSGFVILGRVLGKNGAGQDLLRFPPKPSDTLTFWLSLRNSDSLNFDDLPAVPAQDRMLYFSNTVTDLAAPRDNLHLTSGSLGVNGTVDSVKTCAARYRHIHSSVPITTAARVVHVLTNLEVQPTSVEAIPGNTVFTFDLSKLPIGKCQLSVGGTFVEDLYFVGASLETFPFGVIELSLSDLLDSNYRIVESDRGLTPLKPYGKIRFLNRHTTWRYIFHLNSTNSLAATITSIGSDAVALAAFKSGLAISSNEGTIAFAVDSVSSKEIVFKSTAPIPLHEKYMNASNRPVRLNFLSGGTTVKSDLPFPSTSMIDARALPANIFSDVFLTL